MSLKKVAKMFLLFLIIINVLCFKNVWAETYNGEYSIDYLLRNYNVVSFGDVKSRNVAGPVLVKGNYSNNYGAITVSSSSETIPSYIQGTKSSAVTVQSTLITDSNYIDFDKLYVKVVNESKALASSAEYHLNNYLINIDRPGNYVIHNTSQYWRNASNVSSSNVITIRNYDKNKLYVFNMYNQYVNSFPAINIVESGASTAVSLKDYADSGNYKGNIIFNFPNAISFNYSENRWDETTLQLFGTAKLVCSIIAPKAKFVVDSIFNGASIIAKEVDASIQLNNSKYSISEKVVKSSVSDYSMDPVDYEDDDYRRDYSIKDLLQNYSIVALGKKDLDSKSKLLAAGQTPGSVKLFHITGQALISGNLFGDVVAFDLESNEVNESYVKGNILKDNKCISVIQPWDNMTSDNMKYVYKTNSLYRGQSNVPNDLYYAKGLVTGYIQNYINFDRLYDNIVAEQASIEEGERVSPLNGVTHIKTGGNYVIEDISNISEIVFDDFEDNKDLLTIITIKNSGDVTFPLISKNSGNYKGIVTNDYYGKKAATHSYEADTFIANDTYHGNIVWNLPDATFITLKENAPFVGHLIAPKADVETPELHFAGCFIVNSIYGEGNTEAHFYPITAKATYRVPEYEDEYPETFINKLNNRRLMRLLGGDSSIVQEDVTGNENQYQNDVDQITTIIDNEIATVGDTNTPDSPDTGVEIPVPDTAMSRTAGLILGGLTAIIIGFAVVSITASKKDNKE